MSTRGVMATVAIALLVASGCNSGAGSDDGGRAAPAVRDAGPEIGGEVGGSETEPDKLAAEATLPTEPGEPPEVLDLDSSVENLGAIPAWQAVVERNQYLARRGQSAVVFGRVGDPLPGSVAPDGEPAASELVWLIDETEGGGALAIRVHFGALPAPAGTRVAVRGAWQVDDAGRWVWKASAVTPLPPGKLATPIDPPTAPGLTIAVAEPPVPRAKLRPPAQAQEGELMEFTVTTVPPRQGDGWGISDRRSGELMAFLVLPGERDSFGGHDLRQADERWRLQKGTTYWVRVGKVRRRDGKTPVITAAAAPVRFP